LTTRLTRTDEVEVTRLAGCFHGNRHSHVSSRTIAGGARLYPDVVTPDEDGADLCPCGAPVVCLICGACPEHCHTDGGPDECWASHEAWREQRDGTSTRPPPSVGPEPPPASAQPRWPTPRGKDDRRS
jgi:hypothetical protein